MEGKILSVRTKEKKSTLIVIEIEADGKSKKYTVSEGTYRKVGCPLSGEIIDGEALFAVERDDEQRRAMAKALSLLSYADNNEKTLYTKLLRAGFGKETAKFATEECVRLGYVDERRQIERIILRSAAELIGPYKIITRLLTKGYSRALSFEILEELRQSGEIDFASMRDALLQSKLPEGATPLEKRKLLHRYGYTKC